MLSMWFQLQWRRGGATGFLFSIKQAVEFPQVLAIVIIALLNFIGKNGAK